MNKENKKRIVTGTSQETNTYNNNDDDELYKHLDTLEEERKEKQLFFNAIFEQYEIPLENLKHPLTKINYNYIIYKCSCGIVNIRSGLAF